MVGIVENSCKCLRSSWPYISISVSFLNLSNNTGFEGVELVVSDWQLGEDLLREADWGQLFGEIRVNSVEECLLLKSELLVERVVGTIDS